MLFKMSTDRVINLKHFFITIILIIWSTGYLCDDELDDSDPKPKHKNCEELNSKFIQTNNNFTSCVLRFNENATYCIYCIEEYNQTLTAFDHLMHGEEHHENEHKATVTCRSRFIDNNQLDLVENVLAYSKHLWEIGFCSDCFVPECAKSGYNLNSCVLSNRTKDFKSKFEETISCIDKFVGVNDTSGACTNCTDSYNALNKMYDSIRLKTTNKFCFAMKFWMNTTQFRWANETGCCAGRETPMADFYALSSSSIVFAIAFYIATFLIGKRNERIQYIPDDLMPPGRSDAHNETVMNINPEVPSTSEDQIDEIYVGKIINVQADSSSSDDDADILPIQNQNLIRI